MKSSDKKNETDAKIIEEQEGVLDNLKAVIERTKVQAKVLKKIIEQMEQSDQVGNKNN